MELWIRSQNKKVLVKVNDIAIETNMIYGYYDRNTEYELLGSYQSKERALEVLDEIQSKIKQQFLCKPTPTLSCKDIERAGDILNLKYKQDFIMEPPGIDIEPINISTIVYEMPEK